MDILKKIGQAIPSKTAKKIYTASSKTSAISSADGGIKKLQQKPFDSMNNIVANLILNLTRYE